MVGDQLDLFRAIETGDGERLQRRLARKAQRENERRAAAAPLLAAGGLVQFVGVEEMRQRRDSAKRTAAMIREQHAEMNRLHHAEAGALRGKVGARVVPEVLAVCDLNVARRFPQPAGMGVYVRWFWQQRLDLLAAGQPALPPVYLHSQEEQAASIAKIAALKKLWDAVAAAHPDLMARVRLYDEAALRELQALREAAEIAAGMPPRTRE